MLPEVHSLLGVVRGQLRRVLVQRLFGKPQLLDDLPGTVFQQADRADGDGQQQGQDDKADHKVLHEAVVSSFRAR